jgi:hypothetical protein
MIEFEKITKTLDGFDCHYFGTRESFGRQVHCLGVFHPVLGVHEVAYDANGKRLKFENGSWIESTATSYQIVKPMRKVEVTRWVGLRNDSNGNYTISTSTDEENFDNDHFFAKQQHTFRFEVPE